MVCCTEHTQSLSLHQYMIIPLPPSLPPSLPFSPAEIQLVVCQESKLEALYAQAQNCLSLRLVVKIGSQVSEEEREQAEKNGVKLYSMDQVEVETLIMGVSDTKDSLSPSLSLSFN